MTNDKQRERLVELLQCVSCNAESCSAVDCGRCGDLDKLDRCQIEAIADRILADGWMRPPCKVGQTVYFLHRLENRITEHKVDNFYVGKKGISIKISGVMHPVKPYEFGRIFFSTKEEGEEALKGGVKNG